jgi:hypothetical protein
MALLFKVGENGGSLPTQISREPQTLSPFAPNGFSAPPCGCFTHGRHLQAGAKRSAF